MTSHIDPASFDRRATASTRSVLAGLSDADLDRRAPSTDWTVRGVLAHLVGGNVRFGQALRGEPYDWPSRDHEPVVTVHAEFDATGTEFAATVEALDDEKRTIDFVGVPMPAGFVVRIHASDMLVHGWDLGLVTGRDVELDPQLCLSAIATLEQYPDSFWGPGSYFAAKLEPVGDDPMSRLLALSGRDRRTPAR